MTAVEVIVIVAGLAGGWFAVSALTNFLTTRHETKILDRFNTGEEVPWSEVLGISPDSDLDQIESAYAERVRMIQAASPGVLTQPEAELQRKRLSFVEAARLAAVEYASSKTV